MCAAPVAPKLTPTLGFDFIANPEITIQTSLGSMVVELNPDAAPNTVANMLAYVGIGFYAGTIFHRVIPGFMDQGGGFTPLAYKTPVYSAIALESNNGLSNVRGTIAMARTSVAGCHLAIFYQPGRQQVFRLRRSLPTWIRCFWKGPHGVGCGGQNCECAPQQCRSTAD
jgi:hypothetical protein